MANSLRSSRNEVFDFVEGSIVTSAELYEVASRRKLKGRRTRVKRVAGGSPALRGHFPHQVSLQDENRKNAHFCGASVIHPLLLLTAASCLIDLSPSSIQVVTGDHQLSISEGTEQIRNVSRAIIHEHWDLPTKDNDIALLVLDEPLRFDNYTSPIQLAAQENATASPFAYVSGWGSKGPQARGVSDVLQWAVVRLRDQDQCRAMYQHLNHNVTDNMICAGGRYRDACNGDAGSPLVCQTSSTHDGSVDQPTAHRYLCGIVSWGVPCGTRAFPGVYTNVSKYHHWIEQQKGLYSR